MNERRILHILPSATSENANYIRIVGPVVEALRERGDHAEVWFLQSGGPLVERMRALGAKPTVIGWQGSRRDIAGLSRFWNALRKSTFHLIHCHPFGSLSRLVACSATKSRIVAHLHGRVLEAKGLELQELSLRRCDAAIAVSRAVASCTRHGVPLVIYPGIRLPEPAPLASRCPNLIGAAGRFVPAKGLAFLIRAFSSLAVSMPDVRMQIAGAGLLEGEIREAIGCLGLADRVELLGWQDDMAPLFRRWAIFAQPSLEEAFGLCVLEAMAEGLPVVASSVGGIPEIVEDGRTGLLVPAADPDALASALSKLLSDGQSRRTMGEAGRAAVSGRFGVERMVREILRVYDDLLPLLSG